MSPYKVTLEEVVDRFATSPERMDIMDGLLRYRSKLRSNGATVGFQWLDGSFVEDVEATRGRPPNDIDIVTFLPITQYLALQNNIASDPSLSSLIVKKLAKVEYKCDVHFVQLGFPDQAFLVDAVRYYCGLFSHRRDTLVWKGMLQVPLDSSNDDADAKDRLARRLP
jgi:hypothetical protein